VKNKFTENKIYTIAFLTIIVLISVVLLMFIASITLPRGKAQQDEEVRQMLAQMFEDMHDFELSGDMYSIIKGGEVIGYAFRGTGKGYGGDINILIGLNSDKSIKDIVVLSHTETPGLGSKITESSFLDQFKGLTLEDLKLSKEGGSVDAITGATISSKAMVDGVKQSIEQKLEEMGE